MLCSTEGVVRSGSSSQEAMVGTLWVLNGKMGHPVGSEGFGK